jgi:hypothetical protein
LGDTHTVFLIDTLGIEQGEGRRDRISHCVYKRCEHAESSRLQWLGRVQKRERERCQTEEQVQHCETNAENRSGFSANGQPFRRRQNPTRHLACWKPEEKKEKEHFCIALGAAAGEP